MNDSTGLSWIQLNDFEIFNDFELRKITFKTFLRFFLITCKTVSRKLRINREAKSKTSQFSYSVTVVKRTMKFLAVVTPPYIY